jgi:hypothetical protein
VPPVPEQFAGSGAGPGGSCGKRSRQIANWLLLAGSLDLARHSSPVSQPRSVHTPLMQPRKLKAEAVSHSMSALQETWQSPSRQTASTFDSEAMHSRSEVQPDLTQTPLSHLFIGAQSRSSVQLGKHFPPRQAWVVAQCESHIHCTQF